MPSSSNDSSSTAVRVAVRVRPMLALEHGNQECLNVNTSSNQINIGKNSFTYDYALNQDTTQVSMYDKVVTPMLNGVADGYNVTLLAYGQTGSGKTYTMGTTTDSLSDITGNTQGIMPRAVDDLFKMLQQKNKEDGTMFNVTCSLLEIYNESLHDLMVSSVEILGNHSKGKTSLGIREQKDGSVIVPGLREIPVNTVQDVLVCIRDGSINRATSSTNMNATSSRSHMIVTLTIEHSKSSSSSSNANDEVGITNLTSKLTLVDLAGSERLKRTGATGARAKEGININKGLLALGNVINALADDQRSVRAAHVPYRDSKLTRLLQDALGGNSRTLFIACVSPSESNFEETLNTLRYANRARNIRNKAVLNCSPQERMMMMLNFQVNMLANELVRHKFYEGKEGSLDDVLKLEHVQKFIEDIKMKAANEANMPNQAFSHVMTSNSNNNNNSNSRRTNSINNNNVMSKHLMLPPSAPSTSNNAFPILPPTTTKTFTQLQLQQSDDQLNKNVNIKMMMNEEMVFLDHELELARAEMSHDEENEKSVREISDMESQLITKQNMLIRIKETISDYHELQQRFVWLQNEVTQTEGEKQHLINQLAIAEKEATSKVSDGKFDKSAATAKVVSMKKKLDVMNSKLRTLKDEQRTNKDALSRAKSEKTRADKLEKSINELKQAKARAIKQQTKREKMHREYQKKKTAEINSLKNNVKKEKRVADKSQRKEQQHALSLQRKNKVLERLKRELKQTKRRMLNMIKQNTKRRRQIGRKRNMRNRNMRNYGKYEMNQTNQVNTIRESAVNSENNTQDTKKKTTKSVVDADLEARQHILALHVEYHVRKVELEEQLQIELQRREQLLQEMAIMEVNSTEENNSEEDEEKSTLQLHIDTISGRIEELETELTIVNAKCDLSSDGQTNDVNKMETDSDNNNATPRMDNTDTVLEGMTKTQYQQMVKHILHENIEVKQSERTREAILEKTKKMLDEELFKRKAAEEEKTRLKQEIKRRTAAYAKELNKIKEKFNLNGLQVKKVLDSAAKQAKDGTSNMKHLTASSKKRARSDNHESRLLKRTKNTFGNNNSNNIIKNNDTSNENDQENNQSNDNSNNNEMMEVEDTKNLKCHPEASNKDKERFRKAMLKQKKIKAEQQQKMKEKLESEELKRKGMTRQLLKKQQNHNHSSSNNNYGKEEDISRDRANSLPDMVF